MNPGKPPSFLRRISPTAGIAAVVVPLVLAAACAVSYLLDCAELRRVAQTIAASKLLPSERVVALTQWVQEAGATRENGDSFVFPALRATPIQVLRGGGDCADKSRLLSAMLREIEIPATMIMCFHRHTRVPTHTVIEAAIEEDKYMVADPAYGIYFPRDGLDGYNDVTDLRSDPAILDRRLDDLLEHSAHPSPLHSYNLVSAAYDHASSINWNKNGLTRRVQAVLAHFSGNDVYRWPRPLILEEPKLFVAALLVILALGAKACMSATRRLFPGWRTPILAPEVVLCGP